MKILAFAGSNSSNSINLKLVHHVISLLPADEIELLDLNEFEMPIYSPEREQTGYPQAAQKFLDAVKRADGIVCSLAEHNGSYSTAFKNIFDWASRINRSVFASKPMLLLATSPGPGGGKGVLSAAKGSFPFFGGNIVETFSLPNFGETFNSETGIVPTELRSELERKVALFQEKVHIS